MTQVAEERGHGLRDVGPPGLGDGVEQVLREIGLRLDHPRQPHDQRGSDARVALTDRSFDDALAAAHRLLGVAHDGGHERDAGAPPLGGGERFVETSLDLFLERGLDRSEQPARDRGVAPDQRLAIGEQHVEDGLHRSGGELAQRVGVALLRAQHGLAGSVLDELRGQPPDRQRARAGAVDPALEELWPRHQRERERVCVHRASYR